MPPSGEKKVRTPMHARHLPKHMRTNTNMRVYASVRLYMCMRRTQATLSDVVFGGGPRGQRVIEQVGLCASVRACMQRVME